MKRRGIAIILLLVAACGQTVSPSDSAPHAFGLVVAGSVVERDGRPAAGLMVQGRSSVGPCNAGVRHSGEGSTRSTPSGHYRILVVSPNGGLGRCLALTVHSAESEVVLAERMVSEVCLRQITTARPALDSLNVTIQLQ